MSTIIKYEFKKIMQRKISIISIILLLIMAITIPFTMSIGKYYTVSYDTTTDTTESVENISAIPYLREAYHKQSGYLTAERFTEYIVKNNALRSDPKNLSYSQNIDTDGNITESSYLNNGAYLQQQDSEDVRQLLNAAFSSNLSINYYNTVDNLQSEDGAKYYQKRTDKIIARINDDYPQGNFTQKEKEIILEMNDKVEQPFYYDYHEGWNILLINLSGLGAFITIVCLICLSPVFSGEYQSGNDSIILTTKNGRNKLAKIKIFTGFLFTTGVYFGCILLNFLVTISLHGTEGFNCPIQIEYYFSVYNLTMLQSYLLCALLVYLAMLSIISLVLLVSSIFKTPFSTIILVTAIFVMPIFIKSSMSSRLINYLVTIFPINVMNGLRMLQSYILFNCFGFYLNPIFVYIVAMLGLSAICIPFTINGYTKHQVR